MRKVGLIGGEHERVTRGYLQTLGTLLGNDSSLARTNLLQTPDYQSALRAALLAGDWPIAGRYVQTIAYTLTQMGADALALCSFGLHRYADSLAPPEYAPLLRMDEALAVDLHTMGVHHAGHIVHSNHLHDPSLRYRLYAEHSIELHCPYECDFAAIDQLIERLDSGESAHGSDQLWAAIQRRWTSPFIGAVVTEDADLERLAQPHFRWPTLAADRSHARAIARYLLEQPDPPAAPVPPKRVSIDMAESVQSVVARMLGCDLRCVDFTVDDSGEIAVVLPFVPDGMDIPAALNGVRLLR